MILDSDLADIAAREISPNSPDSDVAISIYAQELLAGDAPEDIRSKLDGLVTTLYYDEDGKPIGVSSVDTSFGHMGDFVLEWLAVDEKERGLGYGRAIIGIILNDARHECSDGILAVTAQPSSIDYYLDIGAEQDDDGLVYFKLDPDS